MRLGLHFQCFFLLCACCFQANSFAQSVPAPVGTQPLQHEGDLASDMVEGLDRFLLNQIRQVYEQRLNPKPLTAESSAKLREQLRAALGIRDERAEFASPEVVIAFGEQGVIAENERLDIAAIRWPVLNDPSPQGAGLPSIQMEGLLLKPRGMIRAAVIVVPDAGQTPEDLSGIGDNLPEDQQTARHLAELGCAVVIPTTISRDREKRLNRADLTHREYLHRTAFELGRTLAGYEIQGILGIVDWVTREFPGLPCGITGYGEGGLESLYAAAVDERIDAAMVSGFFGPREGSWQEPIDRNFFGLLNFAGAAEAAALVMPRKLFINPQTGPEVSFAGNGGAPAVLRSPAVDAVQSEFQRLQQLAGANSSSAILMDPAEQSASEIVRVFGRALTATDEAVPIQPLLKLQVNRKTEESAKHREQQLIRQIDRHTQSLLRESSFVRKEFMKELKTDSVEAYEQSVEDYRTIFRKSVIGEFSEELLPVAARSRKSWETTAWTGHEVVLDVFEDVFAYGVLLLPKDLKPGEQRPVVVCQHGLEGRPTDCFLHDHQAYHDFAAKLCERGFITFCPQNPYIFNDRFRTLQRKAQPLGKTLFSLIVPQHQQIVNWLKTQPFVDPSRIAFYGLSYGGKSAMRIPALVTDYCLSICSADFNEWVLKNATTRHGFSYVWTGEYEIFEWDLGSTFNYAEMAALICPRPFMVERGHFDGVGEDDWVAYEYARVRHLYAARLGLAEKTEIEWFVGPHTINGQGTYDFLHRHLKWPNKEDE